MAKIGVNASPGTQTAIAIVLLWVAGLCFFVAFMSGKTAALTSGHGQDGTPSGPRDLSGVAARVAQNVQAMEASSPPGGAETGPSETGGTSTGGDVTA